MRPEERSVAIREEEYALELLLAHLDFLEQSIALVQQEIQQRLEPSEAAAELLGSIPTVGEAAIATIISEIGVDRERFPSDKHVASWAGGCPGNYESAGKRLSGKTPHSKAYLRAVLCELAWVVAHTKGSYLSAFYHRVVRRRGKKRAILTIAHKLLVIIYHVLKTKKPYHELGEAYFDQLERAHIERRAIRRLEQLGYEVSLTPKQIA